MQSAEDLFGEISRAGLQIDNSWLIKQTNALDARTGHIYSCNTLADLNEFAKKLSLSESEASYAIHRWRNFKRHEAWQSLILENVPETKIANDRHHKTIDFVIHTENGDVAFDLKVTRYPKSARESLSNQQLAEWFFRHQSREGRFHLANRFFVVGQPEDALYNLSLARETIRHFSQDMRSFRYFVEHDDGLSSRAVILRQIVN